MKNQSTKNQRGIALLFVLFALLLLTAIATGLMFMTDTETSINANYKSGQQAYFAAMAGLQEGRDRLIKNGTYHIPGPTALPTNAGGVVYLTNGTVADPVQPWNIANRYYDDDLCHQAFPGLALNNPGANIRCSNQFAPALPNGANWYLPIVSSAAAAPASQPAPAYPGAPLYNSGVQSDYKWVRITLKTNSSAAPFYVNGVAGGATANTMVCWDGATQVLLPGAFATCAAAGYSPVYILTSMAQTAAGSRRMLSAEVVPSVSIPVSAAIFSRLSSNTGQALNVTGNKSPWCSDPSTYGMKSGTGTVTTPGQGNVTGTPAATLNNAGWPYQIPSLMGKLQPKAQAITNAGTGVTGTGVGGTQPPFVGVNAVLGVAPTVNPATGPITSVSNPGTPQMYYASGNLTLGGTSGAGVSGAGVLLVNGNLTIDVTRGFKYYGLIIVSGDVTIIAANNAAVNPQIHGALILGGAFSAPISNMSGSVSVFQNTCMVDQNMPPVTLDVASFKEVLY